MSGQDGTGQERTQSAEHKTKTRQITTRTLSLTYARPHDSHSVPLLPVPSHPSWSISHLRLFSLSLSLSRPSVRPSIAVDPPRFAGPGWAGLGRGPLGWGLADDVQCTIPSFVRSLVAPWLRPAWEGSGYWIMWLGGWGMGDGEIRNRDRGWGDGGWGRGRRESREELGVARRWGCERDMEMKGRREGGGCLPARLPLLSSPLLSSLILSPPLLSYLSLSRLLPL